MAEGNAVLGRVQSAWKRFWGLKWKIKGPVMGLAAIVVLAAASAGGAEEEPTTQTSRDPEATSASAENETPATTQAKSTSTPGPTNTPKPTDTPKPTNTPRPTATPAPPTSTPEPAGYSFGTGKKIVGTDIAPATYRTRSASAGCYYERLSGFGGTLSEILDNENTNGPAIVTITANDVGFNSARCARWTQDLSPITASPTAPFPGDGTWFVGVDIAPGTWVNTGTPNCYWARLEGFSGSISDIAANDNESGTAIVTISPNDVGFSSARCGTWTLQ